MKTILQAMGEYASALRGDWGDFDGRSNLHTMEQFITALHGGTGADWTIEHWRRDLDVCPAGKGHWSGSWGHCDEECGEHDWSAP